MNEIKNEINYFLQKIDSIYKIKEVYIFGSYAYGTPNNDSDIDICIITEEDDISIRDMLKNIRKSTIDVIDKPLDILIYKKDHFEERSVNESTIEYTISKKGVKVYGE
jgi:uncharacterized protein